VLHRSNIFFEDNKNFRGDEKAEIT